MIWLGEQNKSARVLSIYNKLVGGEVVNKTFEANWFGVNEKSIQRDIDEIRNFLSQSAVDGYGVIGEIVYDRTQKGYRLETVSESQITGIDSWVAKQEIGDDLRKKKVMGLILIVSLVLTATPASKQKIMAISQSTIPSGYIGIYDADDLAGIANKPRANYILMNDIDLSETARGGTLDTGKGWKPIKEFDGVLDGNGHYIKNMNIFGVTDDDCGLFSDMQGTVKKLGLTNVNINVETEGQSSNNVYVGAIAASSGYDYGRDDSNFEQCFVTGTISVRTTKEHVNVGAFAGGGYGDHITDCYNGSKYISK